MDANDVVTVDVDPGNPPRTCRPNTINVLVDDANDAYPPASKTFRIHRPGVRAVEIKLFDQLDHPDTVRGVSVSEDGRSSAAASIAVEAP